LAGEDFTMVTTPNVPGYKVKKVLELVTGLTPRTRGVGGEFKAGIESMLGREVTTLTSEIEKARGEAIERMKKRAIEMGANAVIGSELETSEVLEDIMVTSATGTTVAVEPE